MTPTAIGLTNSAVAGAFERHALLAPKGDHLKIEFRNYYIISHFVFFLLIYKAHRV